MKNLFFSENKNSANTITTSTKLKPSINYFMQNLYQKQHSSQASRNQAANTWKPYQGLGLELTKHLDQK